jgi:D-cysteine desulfhydrase
MKLTRIPRRRYTRAPTPIEHLVRLSDYLGGPAVYMKRDDLTGLAGGGNKTRKLEFLVADALAQGCDTLLTAGALQSNHCRLTAAAAAQEGLKCQLVLHSVTPERFRTGNRLLDDILGVETVTAVEPHVDENLVMADIANRLSRSGRRAYSIPVGGSNALGALGYVACAQELLSQLFEARLAIDHLICTTSSCGTHAGLVAGLFAMNSDIRVTGINIGKPSTVTNPVTASLAREALGLLGVASTLPENFVVSRDDWIGPGYALPTDEMVEAVQLVARLEGILLDPVYTGKAMAGLIGLIRRGEFDRGQSVLFLHTGGSPALFAYGSLFECMSG